NAWCIHHLSISKKASKFGAKDIYSAVTDILASLGSKFIISYHRPDKAWNKRNYYDFVEMYPDDDGNFMELFNLFDGFTENATGKFEENVANKYQLSLIEKYLVNLYPPIVLEATNVFERDLKLKDLKQEFSGIKIVRGREYIVYSKDESIKAFAMVEWSESSRNIFNLFDCAFIYILSDLNDEEMNFFMDSILSFYKSKNKSKCLIMIKDSFKLKINNKNVFYLCDENRWIARSLLFKKYHAFTQTLYGHIILKREKIKKRVRKL